MDDDGEELDAMGQAEYPSLVGQLMWVDRIDTGKAIGKLATQLGPAPAMDRRNAVHVLHYLKGAPRVMTVKGETCDEDVLKMVLVGSVHAQADAVWGGDPNRKSTSGVIVWVKATFGKWFMAQSASRKQIDEVQVGGDATGQPYEDYDSAEASREEVRIEGPKARRRCDGNGHAGDGDGGRLLRTVPGTTSQSGWS